MICTGAVELAGAGGEAADTATVAVLAGLEATCCNYRVTLSVQGDPQQERLGQHGQQGRDCG